MSVDAPQTVHNRSPPRRRDNPQRASAAPTGVKARTPSTHAEELQVGPRKRADGIRTLSQIAPLSPEAFDPPPSDSKTAAWTYQSRAGRTVARASAIFHTRRGRI